MTDPDHYIKPLTQTAIPRSHMVLAACSLLGGDRSGYTQTWRRGALWLRHETDRGAVTYTRRSHAVQGALWADVGKHANRHGLSFLWVHDLQWTARVSGMLDHLPAMGWRLDAFALNPGASWMVWRRNRHTIKVVDLLSVWPHSIERIALWFGAGRIDPPAHDASDMAWMAHVGRDRDILVTAVEAYLEWVAANELGTLAVTGNAQAWKAFRRRFLVYGISVHHDRDLRALERRAMWTGRAEAYWRGSLLREVVDEWDFTMAHNEICRSHALPVIPHLPVTSDQDMRGWLADPHYTVLAEVDIETDTECVPAFSGDSIIWPVGRFRTVLWGPELAIALDECHSVRLVRGWTYRTEPVLRGWADWIAAHMEADDHVVPAWQKDILKRWSNILPGRFGMRYPRWVKVGQSGTSTVSVATLNDGTGDELGSLVQIGHDLWEERGWSEPRDSAPMITGYVMSAMRAKLWRLMRAMPPKALLYVDTDSVLASDSHRKAMRRLARRPEFAGLRLKRSWDGLSIYGPRQLVTGQEVRVSGLPKSAQRLGRTEFEGEVTESLLEALKAGHPGAVHSVARQWDITGVDVRRAGTGFGWTTPLRIDWTARPQIADQSRRLKPKV
jgi:hypothetical protein